MKNDVCIIGGGIMGLSTAFFLKRLDPAVSICVVEPDPSYEFSSTLRASGGARRLFSCPENIQMSNFSIAFIKNFENEMGMGDEVAPIGWREEGYLFLVPAEGVATLEQNARVQRGLGADIVLLDKEALKQRYPSMYVDDVAAAALSSRDGWCDPNSFLLGLRKKARSLGVEFIQDRVVDLVDSTAVRSAMLEVRGSIEADVFVIAAGAWSAQIAATIDMYLPIAPMRRFEHYFTVQTEIEPLPFVKDLARLAFRPEGGGYVGSLVNSNETRGFNFDIDHSYFDEVVWPALAHRFPAFEATKCHRSWAGIYEQCELDGNAIIGNWKARHENIYVVTGFSGHGLMHAPAAGRAIAEMILHGESRSIDLARLGYERVLLGEPYREAGIL